MAIPTTLLIAIERLKQDDYASLRFFSRLHAPTVDTALIDSAVQQVALDKIAFAKDFLASAKDMLAGTPSKIDLRNAISRAYYAVHHTLRAIILYDLKADPYGHTESIDDFVKRMKVMPALNAKAIAAKITETALLDILHCRHIADYHCYGSSDPFEQPIDFSVIAPLLVNFSANVVVKMEEYLQDRIAGIY